MRRFRTAKVQGLELFAHKWAKTLPPTTPRNWCGKVSEQV